MKPDNNLLVELHRWAWRQDENFTTDAFAHLLRHLLTEQPAAGVELLTRLIGGAIEIPLSVADSVAIRTQKPTEENGIPDVRISGSGFLVLIEVKVGAEVDLEQLKGYLAELDQFGVTAQASLGRPWVDSASEST